MIWNLQGSGCHYDPKQEVQFSLSSVLSIKSFYSWMLWSKAFYFWGSNYQKEDNIVSTDWIIFLSSWRVDIHSGYSLIHFWIWQDWQNWPSRWRYSRKYRSIQHSLSVFDALYCSKYQERQILMNICFFRIISDWEMVQPMELPYKCEIECFFELALSFLFQLFFL